MRAMRLDFKVRRPVWALGVIASAALFASLAAQAQTMKPYWEFKKPKMLQIPGDVSLDTNGAQPVYRNPGSAYSFGFEGVTQYDGAAFGRNFIPPDTMGAVGMSQYVETSNGAYAV